MSEEPSQGGFPPRRQIPPPYLTESEARAFDLMMHADMFKPGLHVVTDEVFKAYLSEARQQGKDIRAVTELLFKYGG